MEGCVDHAVENVPWPRGDKLIFSSSGILPLRAGNKRLEARFHTSTDGEVKHSK